MQISTNSDKLNNPSSPNIAVALSGRKLKIAMLGHKRMPSREGGVEIVVEELSTRMVELGHEVTVYNRRGRHVSGDKYAQNQVDEYKGVKIKSVSTLDKKGIAAITASFSAAIRAMSGDYDVVHFHAEGPCMWCFLPKLSHKKVIATIHGLDHQRAKWGFFGKRSILMGERGAVRFADEIIVLSRGVQKYFKDTYNRDTVFIPNGITRPEKREASDITEKWGLKKDEYILFLGRLVPEKGAHYLIKAYRQIQTDKKLVIAGGVSDSIEYLKELKALVDNLKLNDRVIFTDFVCGDVLSELYSNAYIYVLPSDLEGMPLSLLEAMSYGNCCVTSDIEECTSVIEDKGYSFAKGNIPELAALLNRLNSNPESVYEKKAQAADYIVNKYNWDDVVRRTLELYE